MINNRFNVVYHLLGINLFYLCKKYKNMENILLETLGLTREELERMIEQSGKGYFVGDESKLPQWYNEYVLQLSKGLQ